MRLATKILLAFGLLLLVAIVMVAVFSGRFAAGEMRGMLNRGGLTAENLSVRELAAYYRGHNSWDGVESVFPSSMPMMNMMRTGRMLLVSSDKTILVDTEKQLKGKPFALQPGMEVFPIKVSGKEAGNLVVWDASSVAPEDSLLPGLYRALFISAAITGVIALLVVLFLSQSLTAPIRQLSSAMVRFAHGERKVTLPKVTRDEVGELTQSFALLTTEIERQESLRKEMTADIAHELRNPLAILRANLEALSDDVYPLSKESLQPLRESTNLLSRLVDDLRILALADAGQLAMEKTETNIATLLQRVVSTHQPSVDRTRQKILLDITSALPDVVVDPQRIEQVIGNLLDNAIRFSPEDGVIRVSARFVENAVSIAVEDSGPGIPPDQLEWIFERFHQIDSKHASFGSGTGLGLAIARKLVETHGGTLSAENRLEGGARFVIRLPLQGIIK